ncbi:MAG: hypothetical protein ACRDNJ_09465 [Solirubrobacteraceae bacterium]
MTAGTRPASEPAAETPLRDDSRDGDAMCLIFVSAVLGVTGAIALVALINTWFVLGLLMALHITMTTVVCVTIARVMSNREPGQTRARRLSPSRAATR